MKANIASLGHSVGNSDIKEPEEYASDLIMLMAYSFYEQVPGWQDNDHDGGEDKSDLPHGLKDSTDKEDVVVPIATRKNNASNNKNSKEE